jgi:hypothetical protein
MASAAAVCKDFLDTNFAGSDLGESDANNAAECCTKCQGTSGCGFYTFVPPTTCLLKTSNAGKVAFAGYTSGCRWENCTAPPTPPTPVPAPGEQVCNVGTKCAAQYAVNQEGCCPYENAVCCANKQTCCPQGSTCSDSGTYATTCVGAPAGPQSTGLSVCKAGAANPFSTTLPNVIILGDSVSIGYTPIVARAMAGKALVQHSPYDVRDGGAEETAYGIQVWCTQRLSTGSLPALYRLSTGSLPAL